MTRAVRQSVLFVALLLSVPVIASSQITVQGGNQSMSITTAVAGSQPASVTNTAVRVRVRQQAVVTKVTVQTSCPGQRFSLSVVISGAPVGTIVPAVSLNDGMLPTDLLRDIPADNKQRNLSLTFTASATFDQGNSTELGSDVHAVTYTLIAQ